MGQILIIRLKRRKPAIQFQTMGFTVIIRVYHSILIKCGKFRSGMTDRSDHPIRLRTLEHTLLLKPCLHDTGSPT